MKKKILIGTLLASAMVVSVYAHGGDKSYDSQGVMNCQNTQGQAMMRQGQMRLNQMHYGRSMNRGSMMMGMRGMHSRMRMFSGINLSDEQQFKLSILRDEMRLGIKKLIGFKHQSEMARFIGKNGFDKIAFEKYANEMHQKMLDIRANNMEKVFKILTKEQIIELKKNLDK